MSNSIWKKEISIEALNQGCKNSASDFLDIKFSAFGDNWLQATMLVTPKTAQPWGVVHGGINCVLAETVGSAAGFCAIEDGLLIVGAEINASHLKSAPIGETLTATATALKIGKTLQTWNIDITDSQDRLCCQSRLTLCVKQPK